jgi:hypothetical protein
LAEIPIIQKTPNIQCNNGNGYYLAIRSYSTIKSPNTNARSSYIYPEVFPKLYEKVKSLETEVSQEQVCNKTPKTVACLQKEKI